MAFEEFCSAGTNLQYDCSLTNLPTDLTWSPDGQSGSQLAAFLKHGLKVSSACESGLRGTVGIKLSRKEARKLGLKQATTIATKSVRCAANDRVSVTLKASRSSSGR